MRNPGLFVFGVFLILSGLADGLAAGLSVMTVFATLISVIIFGFCLPVYVAANPKILEGNSKDYISPPLDECKYNENGKK
jgi:hypothetical protein